MPPWWAWVYIFQKQKQILQASTFPQTGSEHVRGVHIVRN